MASKKTKPTAGDDVDELFSGLDLEKKPKKTTKTKPTSAASKAIADQDILADLESELAEQPSRPHTPRLKDATRRSTATPPAGDPRKSTDSARSLKATFTPSATSSELLENEKKPTSEPVQDTTPQASGGGWWGGILSTASAAMKQAEAAVTQIQQNEEAKKWAEQVKGIRGLDVNTLRNYGDELRHRALPTFTNILHTLAPPISSHERLIIHITHDIVGYPSLDPLVHNVFGHVMAQVEGGDLLVIQRGQESQSRRSTDSSAGWHDGPWWRQSDTARELGLVNGMPEGTKLCRANAESHANEYFSANGGVEAAKHKATEDVSETNPVRTSDLFLAIQAIAVDSDETLFARTASAEKEKESDVEDQEDDEELICFAVFILDPVHDIEFYTVSQSIPARWVQWLDTPAPLTPHSGEEGDVSDANVPDEIRDIIESGGVDPREWVAEWLEELLNLSIGTVAQRYVARRMGVGEGGLGRGKKRMEELVQDNAGEAARAGVI
ncbi:maintenance of telomere capping protein 1 [Fusarium flagelliforme]|uniref:Maintenance of telomere capping protein 1 n=1 Tax=Fusarium flagelliforme TaxID=2675880 RepID=A0A395N5Y1_9HYPO|nr:maintenance of telomere capping protein 1 [Fusarium flagelliforme]KAH7196610.1 maintenance of telomere capping protein 1 [Fusarium flagelliforme]RFN55534.1 maintenance of telomere capping protein 1 [Fusarium flagelliforme]